MGRRAFLPNVSPPSDLFIPQGTYTIFITNYYFDFEGRFDQTQNRTREWRLKAEPQLNANSRNEFRGVNTYNFPDVVPLQVSLPVLYICYDFVRLPTHCSHVQLGLVAVTFTDVLVQAAPGTVREAARDKHACPLPGTETD